MAVIGMDDCFRSDDFTGDSAEQPGLRGMGMNDVGLEFG
jgi:hypothetical protein